MPDDIWYREYLAVATKLDAATQERDELRAELAAAREQKVEAMAAVIRAVDLKIEAEAERDALREALERIADADPDDGTAYVHAVANAALNKGGADE